MRLLLANEGRVETGDVQEELRCSAPTARAILETLEKLGIGHLSNPGPPEPAALTLTSALEWLLGAHGVKKFSMADPLKEDRRRADSIEKELTPCEEDHEHLDLIPLAQRLSDEEITRIGTMRFEQLRELGKTS